VLVLQTLRFSDEVLAAIDVETDGKVTSAELSMAKSLVNSMEENSARQDSKIPTSRPETKGTRKNQRKETHSLDSEMPESEQRPKAQVIDLMEALKASLGKKSGAARRVAPKKAAKSRKRA